MNASTLRVYDAVLKDILHGAVGPDGILPAEVAVAARFGVSRMVAHAAFKELERHGVVRSKRGTGTRVCRKPSPALARQLKAVSARRIHVVAGAEAVPLHWSEATLRELEKRLAVEGYAVVHVPIPVPLAHASLERLLQTITEEGSSALVLILPGGASQFCQANAGLIFQYHRNVFLFDRGDTPPEAWPFHVISVDPFHEGVLAAECLYDAGYRKLAFWAADSGPAYWAAQRAAGFALGLQRASGGTLSPAVWNDVPRLGAAEICRRLRVRGAPMAVAAANDETASWILEAAARLGMRVPRDFGLLGFDNNPRFRACNLTTVAPPLESVGRILARILSGNLLPIDQFSSVVLRVASRVIARATCAAGKNLDRSKGRPQGGVLS